MAKEELGKLSPEQLKKLGKVISEAKDLTNQQAEIIEKVLAGEEDIGKLRISYLEEYFDIYSKELDRIARKHSKLHDAFLVLDNKLNKNYKALASDVAELEKTLKELAKSSKKITGSNNTKKSAKETDEDTKNASTGENNSIKDILQILNGGVKLDKNQFKEILTKTRSALSNIKLDKDQYQTLLAKLSGTLVETTEAEAKEVKETSPTTPIQYNEDKTSIKPTYNYKDHEANLSVYNLFQELYDRSFPIAQATVRYEGDRTSDLVAATTERNSATSVANDSAKASTETAATSESKPASATSTASGGVQPPQEPPTTDVKNNYSDEEIAALSDKKKTRQDFKKFLDEIATDGIKALTQEKTLEEQRLEQKEKLLKSWAAKEEAIRTSMVELSIAKLQTQEELENRSIEIRLSRLQEATDAELKAQQLLNQIDLQLAKSPDKRAMSDQEAGDAHARKTNADINIKAYQELEKQMADYRAKLDLETQLKTGKELTAKQAAKNEKLTRKLFASRKDAIIKEARDELLAKQQLANLSKINPKVAQEYEKRLAEYKAQLDLASRRANNGILTDEAAKANDKLAQDDFANRRETLLAEIAAEKQFKAELAEAAKNNSKAVQKLEQEMAKAQADLDLESRRANGGILTQEAAEQNARLVRLEFDARKDELLAEYAMKQVAEEDLAKFKENNSKLANAREEAMAKYRAELELEARKENNGILTAEEADRIKDLVDKRYELEGHEMEKLAKKQLKEDQRKAKDDEKKEKRENRKKIDEVASAALSKDNNLIDRFTALSRATEDKVTDLDGDPKDEKVAKAIAGLDTAMTLLSDLAKQLEGAVDKIGGFQSAIDTRLQGSNNEKHRGSYWGQLTRDMMSVGAVTPYFKQEKFAENIKALVEKGISFDLKQRAFLMTIQEKIANTFNVADGTLLRLIRIQQEDSTAGRLGMESALNSFLNNMYDTSEYLSDVAASVRGSLEEMESLMKGAEATEVEFQVQKWMGSLYSVGMSQNAVTTIANALGQIASGQVDALTGNGAGNLLVMAANEAGLSIAEILAEGLDSKNTNKLLQATVNYLAEIAESSKGNNVVQQQLANVFGVKASDLKAAVNLAEPGSTKDVFGKNLTYGNMIKQLNDMANTMGDRTSWGEKLANIWENGQYTLASSLANSPLAYLTYKLAGLLDSTVGGIDLPFINVMGFGVDLNTTVADLMRVASMSAGILGNLGPMVSGLASSFSGQAMLSKMGIGKGSGLEVTHRGSGDGITAQNAGGGTQSTSGSGYAGQSNGNDIKNSTVQEANDSKKKQMIKAKEEEPANQVDVLNNTVIKIYELLDGVAKGSKTLRVRVDNYGLIGSGNNDSNTALSGSGNNNLLGNSGSSGGNAGGNSASSSGGSYSGTGTGSGVFGTSGSSGGVYNSGGNSGGGYGSGSYGSSANIGGGNGDGYGSSGSGVNGNGSIDFGGWNMV